MSPQPRRGRGTPPSHKKPAPQEAPAAAAKPASPPAAGAKAAAPAQPAAGATPAAAKATAAANTDSKSAPVHAGKHARGGRLSRVRKSAAYRYLDELVGAYIPLLVAFVVLFAVVWGWISYGPHTPSPQQSWSSIENKYIPKREAAQLQIVNAPDFTARIAGYKAYDDATTGWIDELGKVSSWSDPKLSDADNQVVKGYVDSFIGTGKQLILYLDAEKTAASAGELESLVEAGQTDEATFTTNWAIAEKAIMGTAASSKTPAALPQFTASPDPCASPAPGVSPDPSATPAVCVSPAPGASASAGQSVAPTATQSPAPSASAAPSPSPAPSK